MSSKSVEAHVPVLDGANYQIWAVRMTAFLRSQGLWNIVKAIKGNPPELDPATSKPEQLIVHAKERLDWSNRDDQALGAISLRLSPNLMNHIGTTAYRTWKNLEDTFGKPGPAMIYADFRQAINFKLSGGNPAPEIARLFTFFARLKANKSEVNEFQQTMILMNALLAKWDHIASAYMLDNSEIGEYKFINLQNAICGEWERQIGSRTQQRADKLSAVKRKGKSPQYKDQKQKANKPKATDHSEEPQHKQGKRGQRKSKGKSSTADDHQHSHLASSSIAQPPVVEQRPQIYLKPSDVPVRAPASAVVATHRPERIFYQPLNHASAQSFTGKTNTQAPYQETRESRELADQIGVTKNPLNLKKLENFKHYQLFVESTDTYQQAVASSSSTRVEDLPAPKPTFMDRLTSPPKTLAEYEGNEKRRREKIRRARQRNKKVIKSPVVVVSDGDEPLDWGTNDGQSEVDEQIAEAAGIHPDFDDEDPDPYVDPAFHRQVNSITITQEEFNLLDKQLQILVATVDSLSSDCNNKNKYFACNSSKCVKCKGHSKNFKDLTFLGDSGASQTFTSEYTDFSTYEKITNGPQVQTADQNTIMRVVGKGTIFLTHEVEMDSGKKTTRSGALHPVYHIPGLSVRLLSVGSLLAGGLSLRGDKTKINFYSGQLAVMTLKPHIVGQTIYWLNAQHTTASSLVASSTVHEVNYDLMHRRFGHPSKDILRRASGNTKNFSTGITYPKNILSAKDVPRARCLLRLSLSQIVERLDHLKRFTWTLKVCQWFRTTGLSTSSSFTTISLPMDGL